MKNLLFLLALMTTELWAMSLCERLDKGAERYLEHSDSRISFKNDGGLLNGGVCWWHARLQRSSAYLAEFKPTLPRPTSSELKVILRHLKFQNSVVTIPGFNNFSEFTAVYKNEIQSMLEGWQREDGFFNMQWLRGISGQYQLPSEKMKERMNILFDQYVKSPQPIWIMAQIKGIESHSFLVLDMMVTSNGFDLKLIDSNAPQITKTVLYSYGDTFLKHPSDSYSYVPYLGFQKDFQNLQASVNRYCGNAFLDSSEIPLGEVEVRH